MAISKIVMVKNTVELPEDSGKHKSTRVKIAIITAMVQMAYCLFTCEITGGPVRVHIANLSGTLRYNQA